jgi:hypothetical protein
MATPKVAARTAGLRSIKRYAGNDSLDAEFLFGVTKQLDGMRGVSLQKSLVPEDLSREADTKRPEAEQGRS